MTTTTAAPRTDSVAGWFVVAASFVALGVVFGVAYNFGSLAGPMRESLQIDASQVGWIFSISSFAFLSFGAATGRIADRYGPRPLVVVGGLTIAAGLALAASAQNFPTAALAYLGVGTGVACVYVPAVSNVGGWFVRHRVQAIGIAVTGIGVGTIVVPVITAALVEAVGWRRTEVYLGAAALVLLLVCAPFMPAAVHKRHSIATWTVRRLVADRVFQVLWLSGFAMGLALYVPFVFLAPMAEHVGVTPARAAVLISVIGFSSTASRVLFGLTATRVGVVFAYKAATVTIWLSYLVWLPSRSFAALVVFALIFGAGYGGTIALSPALLGHYYGTTSLGTASGALFTSASIGALFGAPLAGLLIGADDRYLLAAVAVFVVGCLGTVGQVLLPRDHPAADHPTADHPATDHPTARDQPTP